MLFIGRRLAAIAITAQVGGHHGEVRSQLLGDLVPDDVSLWMTVQQQQGRPATADPIGDFYSVDVALVFAESGKHGWLPVMVAAILKSPAAESKVQTVVCLFMNRV
jgi:hypothetical protein